MLKVELLPLPVILTAGCLESDGNKKVLRRNHIGLQSTWPRVLEPNTFECKTLIGLQSRALYSLQPVFYVFRESECPLNWRLWLDDL